MLAVRADGCVSPAARRALPPTPRFTFWGWPSSLKSAVSLNTATGGACGTSLKMDMIEAAVEEDPGAAAVGGGGGGGDQTEVLHSLTDTPRDAASGFTFSPLHGVPACPE